MIGVSIEVTDELTGLVQSLTYECHSPQRLAQILTTTIRVLPAGQNVTAIFVA